MVAMSSNKKIGILYGFSEGPLIALNLINTLERAGFVVIKDVAKADIIIAHSGGCYMLPSNMQAKLVMLNGLPYQSSNNLALSLLRKIRHDFMYFFATKNLTAWIHKTVLNGYYFFRHLLYWSKMLARYKTKNLPTGDNQTKVICVVNEFDAFSTVQSIKQLSQSQGWQYRTAQGQHDDIWHNPDIYVKLIEKSA